MALLSIPKLTGGDVFEGTDWFDYLMLAAMPGRRGLWGVAGAPNVEEMTL